MLFTPRSIFECAFSSRRDERALGGQPGKQLGQPRVLEEMCTQASCMRAFDVAHLVVDHEAGGGFDSEPAGGEAVDGRVGFGEADVT